jgi:hypothetical protein
VDISAFGLVMWKFGCPMEKCCEEKEQEKVGGETKVIEKEEVIEKEVAVEVAGDGEKETASNKTKEVEEVEEVAGDDVEEENAGEESK